MASAAVLFGVEQALIAMVHVGALPGTPHHRLPPAELCRQAAAEARELAEAGVDAILLENMHDAPYLQRQVGPEIVAGMTAVAAAVRSACDCPLGIAVLAAANHAALAIAHAVGAQFIRAEGFAYASVADEGLLGEADAGPLLRYRRAIGAQGIKILADIKKKHSSHAITADVDVAEMARTAEFFGADAVVISGTATGRPVRLDDLKAARAATGLPLVVGSGVTPESAADLLACADALIAGSCLKQEGHWSRPVDPQRAAQLVQAVRRAGGVK